MRPPVHPLTCPGVPGLLVVPVVRGRLAFAEIAARTFETQSLDAVAVDLPWFLNGSGWLDTALSCFPLPTSIVINRPKDNLLLPFTPSDACCVAAWLARRRGLPFESIDRSNPLRREQWGAFGPEDGLADDAAVFHQGLENYFAPAWEDMDAARRNRSFWSGRAALARAVDIGRYLRLFVKERGRVLFIADYRTWWAVRKSLAHPMRVGPPAFSGEYPAAFVFEDALALWQCGAAELPHSVEEFFRALAAGGSFDSSEHVRQAIEEEIGLFGTFFAASRLPATEIFDRAETHCGSAAAARLANRLLSCRAPTCADAADCLPCFGTIRSGGIENPSFAFEIADVFEARPYYEPSPAELRAFLPPQEKSGRIGWGPTSTPFLTRLEASLIRPSADDRWSIDGNAQLLATAAEMLRCHVRRMNLDPPLSAALDQFTPTVFIWSSESDGDIRSVDDANLTKRRLQLGQLREADLKRESCPAPDIIHTLCATRVANAPWRPGVAQFDIASSIATLYSGPETGPERYQKVTAHIPPRFVCRLNPANDNDLLLLPRDQVAAFFAAKWSSGAVIIAACEGWQPGEPLLKLAGSRGIRMIFVPQDAIPPTLTIRLRRRVFVTRSIRTDERVGTRIQTRFAHWRLQPAPG